MRQMGLRWKAKIQHICIALVICCMMTPPGIGQEEKPSSFFQWQTNEVHFQYGRNFAIAFAPDNMQRDAVLFGNNAEQDAFVYTFQHADGWAYGDNFFFVDFTDAEDTGFDLYTEFYANFSLGKITGNDLSFGLIKDVGILAGANYAKEAKVFKFLPGIRLAWDLPQFGFFNTDIMAYIDGSSGAAKGGAPKETDSFIVDVNWALPFTVGDQDFSLEGHVEYIDGRSNEFGGDVSWHILGQPQLRYDIGKGLFGKPGHFFAGIEYQFWINKLGDRNTDEHVAQALLVARF